MPPSCPHTPINNGSPCSTGSLCFVGQTCSGGTCQGGTAINCDDANPCTLDGCVATTGCTHTPTNQGVMCVAGPCSTGAVCDDGECSGTPVTCVALNGCHLVGTCDDVTGNCSNPLKPDGTSCGTSGECMAGECEGDGVVDPTGGTGGGGPGGGGPGGNNGTAGEESGGTSNGGSGGTGNGTAGEGTSGAAGNGDGGTGNGNGGSGNASGTSNAGEGDEPAPLFERDPGGCACRVPAPGSGRDGYAALALAAALSFVTRRRRRAA
jgi:MYXO-CTERM domain-containing protein